MPRLHCPTCTCGAPPARRALTDPSAPFYALVIEIDRLTLAEQRERYRRSIEREPDAEPTA